MKKLLIAGAALAALIGTPALAADMALKALPPPAPVCVWCGFYIGLNVGGDWSRDPVNFSGTGGTPAAIAAGQVPSSLSPNPAGVIGGGQIGYNYQTGSFVWGLEADIQGASLNRTLTVNTAVGGGLFPVTTTVQEKMDFFGTVRGRIGVAATGPLLLYATGGLAYGDVKESSSVNTTPGCPGFCGSASTSNIRAGWTVGAGGEWQFSPALSGKIEYLYYDLGTINQNYVDFRGLFPGTSVSTSTKTTGNIVRVGLNWHLH